MKGADADVPIKKWDDQDQFQLCHEALQWLKYQGDEMDEMYFKYAQ